MRLLGITSLAGCLFLGLMSNRVVLADTVAVCNELTNQGMLSCASKNYQIADKALNVNYKVAIKSLSAEDKMQFKEAQRAWLVFRDAYCNGIYNEIFPGQEAGVEKATCLWRLTHDRVLEIKLLEIGHVQDSIFYRELNSQKQKKPARNAYLRELQSKYSGDHEWVKYLKLNCYFAKKNNKEQFEMCSARVNFMRSY
jgi:uncharacterized protein YecT (DUF1311 family)